MPITSHVQGAGEPFIVPIHPGDAPAATLGATAAQIAEAICAYNQAVADVTLYNRICGAITAQILAAVNPSFLSALEDPSLGFGNVPVTPRAMFKHIKSEYGTMTPEELETNRAALSEPWKLDDIIEDFCPRLQTFNVSQLAVAFRFQL